MDLYTKQLDFFNMNNLKFVMCPSYLIEYVWKDIKPLLDKVIKLSHNETTLELTKQDLIDGRQNIVLILDVDSIIAVVTTQVRTFDTGLKCLYIPLVGGSRMTEWLDTMISHLQEMAKSVGATELRGYMVRDGWNHVLGDKRGWNKVYQVLSCKVEEQ